VQNESRTDLISRIRIVVRFFWILPAIGVLYVGWTFWARWEDNRATQQRLKDKQRLEAQRGFELLGGNRFEILQFYALPGTIRRGETAQLCYGVSNATKVRLEPQSSAVWPSLSRCVDVAPQRDTTYTLTIEDAAGNTKTADVTVKVR
jgi:hypothetical protein